MPATKVATCCFCGTRAALVLRGRERHELACHSCGAPLHEMKQLHPQKPQETSKKTTRTDDKKKEKNYGSHDRWSRKPKKKKSLRRRVISEIFDVIEDIFD